jgi:hypothetical protein
MTPIYNSLKAPRQKKAGRKGGKKRKKKTHKIAVCTHTCEREKKQRRNRKLDLFGNFLCPAKK